MQQLIVNAVVTFASTKWKKLRLSRSHYAQSLYFALSFNTLIFIVILHLYLPSAVFIYEKVAWKKNRKPSKRKFRKLSEEK